MGPQGFKSAPRERRGPGSRRLQAQLMSGEAAGAEWYAQQAAAKLDPPRSARDPRAEADGRLSWASLPDGMPETAAKCECPAPWCLYRIASHRIASRRSRRIASFASMRSAA
jgi:hypothetical protein